MIAHVDLTVLGLVTTFCILLGLVGVALMLSRRLGIRLRERHPELPREIRDPNFRDWTSIASSRRSARFVTTREHERLNDPVVNRICLQIRVVSWIYYATFAAFLALVILKSVQ